MLLFPADKIHGAVWHTQSVYVARDEMFQSVCSPVMTVSANNPSVARPSNPRRRKSKSKVESRNKTRVRNKTRHASVESKKRVSHGSAAPEEKKKKKKAVMEGVRGEVQRQLD